MVESEFVVPLHVADRARRVDGFTIRPMTDDDKESACGLFDRAHGSRPCSVVRKPDLFTGPHAASEWNAGDVGKVVEKDGRFLGHVIHRVDSFGQRRPFVVAELLGVDLAATQALVREVVDVALERRMEQVTFYDTPDSLTGLALRRIGATVSLTCPHACDAQGLICNRAHLIQSLADELARRAGRPEPGALEALAAGEIYPDDRILLQLLTGFISWHDAELIGHPIPTGQEDTIRKWFPGGGTPELPLPYTHRLDRY